MSSPLGEGTSVEQIREWLREGIEMGATHVIVVLDTFDYDASPEYVMPGEDAKKMAAEIEAEDLGCKVKEVYNLSGDLEAQLKQYRAFSFRSPD
jgi:hypothetical protein